MLLVDFDPQGNLSLCFGIEQPDQLSVSVYNILDAIMSDKPLPAAEEYLHSQGNITLIPSNIELSVTSIDELLKLSEQSFQEAEAPLPKGDIQSIPINKSAQLHSSLNNSIITNEFR
ncbi:ParA family protein [Paenibacillus sophorae]|uniref:ParA family protein n=1 Tax=Paenibacillus sophorae TaxID=1333845 RepID=UPI0006872D1A|nr:AAA family ATPase [Paenibacillus sophorae]